MITSSRILIGTIVAFVVMAAGFAVGLHFHEKRSLTKIGVQESLGEKAEVSPSVNNTMYEISPPSLGLMLETYAITIAPEGPITRVEIPVQDAGKIKTGQRVFLYGGNAELKNSLGTVIGVIPSENFALIEIDLRDNPDISPLDITRGKIIIERNQNAFRLPYSALSRNEKGETFVWEVSENVDGTNVVKYKAIEVLGGNDTVFTMQIDPQATNHFILNPDSNLRDGQIVNVRKFLYQAPSQYEDARIAALVQQRKNQIAGQLELQAIPAANVQASSGSSSCAQSSDVTQNFINKVRSLTEAQQRSAASP